MGMRIRALEVGEALVPSEAASGPKVSLIVGFDSKPKQAFLAAAEAAWPGAWECVEAGRNDSENLATALNAAAQRAKGELLLFLPFGVGGPAPDFASLAGDWQEDIAIAGATPSLRTVQGEAFPNGFALIEDRMTRQPILRTPVPDGGSTDLCSAVHIDCLLIRKPCFWGVGGWDPEVPEPLLGFALCLALRSQNWRLCVRRESEFAVSPNSPSLRRDAREVLPLRTLIAKWQGQFIPDGLRDEAGTVRPHPSMYGFGHIAGNPSHAESERTEHSQSDSISVVILTYNSLRTIGPCFESALRYLGLNDEIILVDNASRDGTADVLRGIAQADPRIRVLLNSENLGFSGGTNVGLRASTGDFVVLLNPDTVVTEGWLARLRQHFDQPDVGAVGPLSDYVAGLQKLELHLPMGSSGQHSYDSVAAHIARANARHAIESRILIGFCMMLRRPVLQALEWLDEELFLGMDDLDLSWRLRKAGFRLLVATDVFVHHEGQVSFKSEPSEKVRALTQRSVDALARKLVRHYGPGGVPTPFELWGIDWFSPSFDAWSEEGARNALRAA